MKRFKICNNILKNMEEEKKYNSYFNYFETNKGNIVWAGALGLAWTELKDKFVKENIVLGTND